MTDRPTPLSKLTRTLENSANRLHHEADFAASLAAEVDALEEVGRQYRRLVFELEHAAERDQPLSPEEIRRLLGRRG